MKSAGNTTLQHTVTWGRRGGRHRTSDRRRRQRGGLSRWRHGAKPSSCWVVTHRCSRTSSRTAPSVDSTLNWLNVRRRRRRDRISPYCAVSTAPGELVCRCCLMPCDWLDSINSPTCSTTRRGLYRCCQALNPRRVLQVTCINSLYLAHACMYCVKA